MLDSAPKYPCPQRAGTQPDLPFAAGHHHAHPGWKPRSAGNTFLRPKRGGDSPICSNSPMDLNATLNMPACSWMANWLPKILPLPFDSLTWDISEIESSGSYQLKVVVQDIVGSERGNH